MKKIIIIVLISWAFLPSCKKAFEQPEDWSSVAVVQASPTATTNPSSDTLQVFVDDLRYNSSGVLYNANTTYLPVLSGTKAINIRRGINNTFSDYVAPFSYSFEKGKSYSFFVYDTTTSSTGQARVLRLKDDLTLPAAGTSHVRFLHLAPNAPAVDITLVRTTVIPNDSVTLANRSYVGASPNEDALSAFTPVPRGSYTVKVKAAGTQTVVLSAAVAITTGADINEGRILTLSAIGTAKGRPLALSAFRHY